LLLCIAVIIHFRTSLQWVYFYDHDLYPGFLVQAGQGGDRVEVRAAFICLANSNSLLPLTLDNKSSPELSISEIALINLVTSFTYLYDFRGCPWVATCLLIICHRFY
jgi:hypothetical protein